MANTSSQISSSYRSSMSRIITLSSFLPSFFRLSCEPCIDSRSCVITYEQSITLQISRLHLDLMLLKSDSNGVLCRRTLQYLSQHPTGFLHSPKQRDKSRHTVPYQYTGISEMNSRSGLEKLSNTEFKLWSFTLYELFQNRLNFKVICFSDILIYAQFFRNIWSATYL